MYRYTSMSFRYYQFLKVAKFQVVEYLVYLHIFIMDYNILPLAYSMYIKTTEIVIINNAYL